MHKSTIAKALLFTLLSALALQGRADTCGPEQYFAPHDANNSIPLRSPHAEFRRTHALAVQGNAAEERNLGSLYEAGYLVSACPEQAAHWYERAARHGDEIAKAWMERHTRMERLRNGPQCFGNACFAAAGGGVQTAVVHTGPGSAYAATVTINGKAVRGIIDTGATFVSMSARTANEVGISYSTGKQVQVMTANGTKVSRAVMLSAISVENITLEQVQAVVSEGDQPLLIGMSFLSRLTMSTSNGGMTLVKR